MTRIWSQKPPEAEAGKQAGMERKGGKGRRERGEFGWVGRRDRHSPAGFVFGVWSNEGGRRRRRQRRRGRRQCSGGRGAAAAAAGTASIAERTNNVGVAAFRASVRRRINDHFRRTCLRDSKSSLEVFNSSLVMEPQDFVHRS